MIVRVINKDGEVQDFSTDKGDSILVHFQKWSDDFDERQHLADMPLDRRNYACFEAAIKLKARKGAISEFKEMCDQKDGEV